MVSTYIFHDIAIRLVVAHTTKLVSESIIACTSNHVIIGNTATGNDIVTGHISPFLSWICRTLDILAYHCGVFDDHVDILHPLFHRIIDCPFVIDHDIVMSHVLLMLCDCV